MLVSISVDEHRHLSHVHDAAYDPIASAVGVTFWHQWVRQNPVWPPVVSSSRASLGCPHLGVWFSTIFMSLFIKRRLKDRLELSQSYVRRGFRVDSCSRRLLVDEPVNYQFCVTQLTVDVHTLQKH